MKKWIKVLIPITVAPVATLFPIVLVTGCTDGDTQTQVEENQEDNTGTGQSTQPTNPVTPTVTKYKVVFNANGGTLTGNNSIQVKAGTKFANITKPTVEKDGFEFVGWDIEDNWEICADIQANAQWKEIEVQPQEEEKEPEVDPTPAEEPTEDPVVDPEEEEPEEEQIVTWSGETNEEYIRNRTISMIERDENDNIVVGTGWILADATPEINNDFVYYVATNAHVAMGFEEFDGVFKYGTYNTRGAGITSAYNEDFWKEKKANEGFDYGVLDGLKDYNYFGEYNLAWDAEIKNNIDFYVNIVDLGDIENENNVTAFEVALKVQLKKINNIQNQYGKINQFVNIEDVETEKFYVGGFPTHNYFEYWQFNEIDANKLGYYEAGEVEHNIGNSEIVDNAEQLILQEAVYLDWLGAGASGSMLIDQYNQIVGIFWGGFADEENDGYFYPAFSVVNQELINQYI